MNIGIIGCGLIGKKRANAIRDEHKLTAVCDVSMNRAEELAVGKENIYVTDDYKKLIEYGNVDIVVIATLNHMLAPITLYAVQHKKHVIVEKPGAIHSKELEPIIQEIKGTDIKVKVGFNHRYHPALLKAKEIIDSGTTGDVMFIRGRYGHGGRVGYEKEWRSDAALSGGGETIDQGVHLIDLSRWFMGDFSIVEGFAATYFWNMDVDDNGFICLRKEDGRAAWLQVSCTEWKNMFSYEIYCKNSKLSIDGLGGSYGVEKLSYYKMLPEMGPPETIIYEYPMGDNSWVKEFNEVVDAVKQKKPLTMGDITDAYEVLKIVEEIYASKSQKGRSK